MGGEDVVPTGEYSYGLTTALSKVGFEWYDLARVLQVPEGAKEIERLRQDFRDLPLDAHHDGGCRYRRYSRAIILPWSGHIEWVPPIVDGDDGQEVVEYFQGDYNPEFSGKVRRFPAARDGTRNSMLLTRIIKFDFAQTFWAPHERQSPINVGLHLVKLSVDNVDQLAVSSPDCLHQDGERFTFAHSIICSNVVGGVNTIATPACRGMSPSEISVVDRLAEFQLKRPLESYAVHDPQVSHHVSAVGKGPDSGPGERGVILLDFTPMTPLM
jgi:hypothetical protein